MSLRFPMVAGFAALAATVAFAADWPQWRGPNRDGYSADKGLVAKWPAAGPKLLYTLSKPEDIGTGYGQPAVIGDKFYIVGADGSKQTAKEFLTCLSTKDGKRIWQKPLNSSPGKYSDGWGGGPRSTPTVQDGYVYVLGVTGDLVCFSADKGDEKWHKNLVKDFGGSIPTWGYSESVLIDGDTLLCTPGGKGGIIALNKATGETVWQCKEVGDGAGYSSIMIATVGGVKQYVQQTMAHGIGVRAKDGKKLWEIGDIKRRTAVIPTPVLKGDIVFFTAGYGAGCEAYKLESDGKDGTKATKLYSNSNITNHHGGAIGFDKYVFGHSDGNGEWNCLDIESGDIVWKNKFVGKGSVSAADGYFYCYGEGTGTLARAKITDKGFEEAGKFTIPKTSTIRPNSGKIWAHPVIADGKLFLRDYELLFVYNLLGPRS